MSQYLPTGEFREIEVTRGSLKTILRTLDNDEHFNRMCFNRMCFLIECDLEYPSSIHEKKKRNISHIYLRKKQSK